MSTPIFLYLKGSDIDLKACEDAGYMPIGVDNLNDVRILQAQTVLLSDPITKAALESIAAMKSSQSELMIAADFAKRLAKSLTERS